MYQRNLLMREDFIQWYLPWYSHIIMSMFTNNSEYIPVSLPLECTYIYYCKLIPKTIVSPPCITLLILRRFIDDNIVTNHLYINNQFWWALPSYTLSFPIPISPSHHYTHVILTRQEQPVMTMNEYQIDNDAAGVPCAKIMISLLRACRVQKNMWLNADCVCALVSQVRLCVW